MPLIYEPKGKAREYSPLALNVYTGGCEHGCQYCFCRNLFRGWVSIPTPRDLTGLERSAAKACDQVLLSFVGDPYCPAERTYRNTRKALDILRAADCSVAILTKGGLRCLDDIETFRTWPDRRIKVGATLTFADPDRSRAVEPGAATPGERIAALKSLHEAGIRTWASIEPVIDPEESLAAIAASLPYVDAYKIGKLNHQATTIDWTAFCTRAAEMVRSAGRRLYVKADLRKFAPAGYLTPAECDQDALSLEARPAA